MSDNTEHVNDAWRWPGTPTNCSGDHARVLDPIEATATLLAQHPEGFTVDPRGFVPLSGYVVALASYHDETNVTSNSFIRRWLWRVWMAIPKQAYFGIWTNPHTGNIELDVCVLFPNTTRGRAHALTFGFTQSQQTIYHVDTDEIIEVD